MPTCANAQDRIGPDDSQKGLADMADQDADGAATVDAARHNKLHLPLQLSELRAGYVVRVGSGMTRRPSCG